MPAISTPPAVAPVSSGDNIRRYQALPTLKLFHESGAVYRCIVGPVGSGKTSGATMEVCYYLPMFCFKRHGIKKTRWVIVRNTYCELRDTTMKTVTEWFPDSTFRAQSNTLFIKYANGVEVEILFRSCDRPQDVRKFKSLEITGYWIDESIEVASETKRMLKNRIGRYPQKSPVKWGIETTNPPDVEHETYSQFKWLTPVPGPMPGKKPLENHVGFWQPPRENDVNLGAGYYNDLRASYRDAPDWVDMYIDGKPGIIVKGKLVYVNFRRGIHVSEEPLVWDGVSPLVRGWDNTGNTPACLVTYFPTPGRWHILREFVTDRLGIVDFAKLVVESCNQQFPGAKYTDYADPAGAAQFSRREGGLTSNAELMAGVGIEVISSDNNFTARVQSVDQQLRLMDGVLIDPSCTRYINGFMGGYCYPEIGTGTGIYGEEPIKNRFSHIHDAGQYIAVKTLKSTPLLVSAGSRKTVPRSMVRHGQGWMN
jgi:hypothetical protein